MRKCINALVIIALCSMAFISCKKDEGEDLFIKSGSVTGTINGINQDGETLEESYTFNTYLDYMDKQYYEITTGGDYEFNIDFSRTDGSYFNIDFVLSNAADTSPSGVKCVISNYSRTKSELVHFSMSSSSNTYSFSDFSFDETTGRTKGKIIMTGNTNSTDKNATVVATFDVTLKELVE